MSFYIRTFQAAFWALAWFTVIVSGTAVATKSLCAGGSVIAFCASLKDADPIRSPELLPVLDAEDDRFDSVVVVTDNLDKLTGKLEVLREPLETYSRFDSSFAKQPILVNTDVIPSGRLIFSSTGSLNRDQDDVRRFADATTAGISRALGAGSKRPLLVRPADDSFEKASMVATLAALHTVYVPLELREIGRDPKVEALGVWYNDTDSATEAITVINALEKGRIVARDIAGSNPERMAPPRIEEYLTEAFRNSDVELDVISDVSILTKEYPLLAAVNRAANTVARHKGRLIFMEYKGSGNITKTLFLVGKGITFDTGGADVKIGSRMSGMHRDKSGAAAVAGFMKVVSTLKPANLRVVAGLPLARNSVGEESYVADEIITSRAGSRVMVDNTDAEGRLVMADVLCRMKELAQDAVNPQLISIGTLTGHAIRSVGPYYSVIMDNGPAMKMNNAYSIQASGDKYGEPFEVSTIRREDYDTNKPTSELMDVHQIKDGSQRGHQTPVAFMIVASGLDKHGIESSKPLPYSNIDIAGSSAIPPEGPTGTPVIALSAHFLLEN